VAAVYHSVNQRSAYCPPRFSRRPFTWALFWHLNEIGAVFVLDYGRSADDATSRWPRKSRSIVELSSPVRRRVSNCYGNCACDDHRLLRVQRGWHDFRYCVFDFNFLARGVPDNSAILKGKRGGDGHNRVVHYCLPGLPVDAYPE